MRFYFGPVGRYDPVPNTVTHLNKLVVLAMLVLNFLKFEMLTLLSLLSMLLIEAKANSLLHYGHIMHSLLIHILSLR